MVLIHVYPARQWAKGGAPSGFPRRPGEDNEKGVNATYLLRLG